MDKKFYIDREQDAEWKKKVVTPRSAVVGLVESKDRSNLLIIKRKYPPHGYAFPGGMLDIGETIKECAIREVMEETGVDAEPIGILNIISDPEMDPRWHVVVVHVLMRAKENVDPTGMDDALEASWAPYDGEGLSDTLIEHAVITLDDYKKWRNNKHTLIKLR